MQQITFRRQTYTQLWMVVTSNEPLGLLPSGGYIEDYFGNPSQITLQNISTGARQPLFFTDTSSTQLSGYIPLSTIADGSYRFEGYLQDLVGNKTIIGEVSNPSISGTSIEAELTILATLGIGAILNIPFQDQNLSFKLVLIDNEETVNIDVGMKSTFWYSVNFLPEIDALLP